MVPPDGLPLVELIRLFKGRITDKARFIALVQAHARWEKAEKMLYPKDSH